MELKEVKNFIEKINQDDICFDPHFYKRTKERPINEGMIRSFLSELNKLKKIELGNKENRFKLWFKMSNKYSLVIIIEIIHSKDLKVVSAWNNDTKWQKQLKQ